MRGQSSGRPAASTPSTVTRRGLAAAAGGAGLAALMAHGAGAAPAEASPGSGASSLGPRGAAGADQCILVDEAPLPVAKFSDLVVDGDDWTAAIAAARDQVAAAASGGVRGGSLRMPGGLVRITSTLEYNQQAVIHKGLGRGSGPHATVVKWDGPPGIPMFRFIDCATMEFEDMSIVGNDAKPPSEAIFNDTPTVPLVGRNALTNIRRVAFGWSFEKAAKYTPSESGAMQYGIRYGGQAFGNGDKHTLEDVQINGCTEAGVRIGNAQATWNNFRNVYIDRCARGLWASGNVECSNMQFNRCGTDLYVDNNARVNVVGYYSEHAATLWQVVAGTDYGAPVGTSLKIMSGKAMLLPEVTGSEWAKNALLGHGMLVLRGLLVFDHSSTSDNPTLGIEGGSATTSPAYVDIRNCLLPRGDSDDGYSIVGHPTGTPIYVDIQQGGYHRKQTVQTAGAPSFMEPQPSRSMLGPWESTRIRRASTASLTYAGSRLHNCIPMPTAGYVTGIAVHTSEEHQRGSARFSITRNADPSDALSATIDAQSPSSVEGSAEVGDLAFAAGDLIGVALEASRDWAPVTSGAVVTVEVVFTG